MAVALALSFIALSQVLLSSANDVTCPVTFSPYSCLQLQSSINNRIAHAGRLHDKHRFIDTSFYNGDIVHSSEAHEPDSNKDNEYSLPSGAISNSTSPVSSRVRARQKRDTIGVRGLPWSKTWPNDVLVYSFGAQTGGFTDTAKNIVRATMAFIASQSCVKFREVPFRRFTRGVLQITPEGRSCRSYVGYNRYDLLEMNLPVGCISRVDSAVAHEIFHILGFFHEHTRKDRDNYVTVRTQYIPLYARMSARSFAKNLLSDPLNTEYDTESVMHYPAFSFPLLPPVMLPKPPTKFLGQTWAPTLMDIYQLNSLYGCSSMLGLGSTLTCHGCVKRVFVVAKTAASQPYSSSPVQLDWVVNENNRFVKKRFLLPTSNSAGRAFRAGSTDFWDFTAPGCIAPRSVQMMALRATSRRLWRPTNVDVFLELYSRHTLLVSSVSLDNKVIKLGTEKETQHLLPPVQQPTCAVCRSDCINQLSVFMEHTQPSNTIRTSTHAIVLSWKRNGTETDFARLDLPGQQHTPQRGIRRTFQSSSVPLDSSKTSTCLTANSLESVYLTSLDSTGEFLFQGPSTQVERAILTARTVGSSRFVLAEMAAPPSQTTAYMIPLKVRRCDLCKKC